MAYIEQFDKLEDIIEESSGFGGYYDLRECLFDIAENTLPNGEELVKKFREEDEDIFKVLQVIHRKTFWTGKKEILEGKLVIQKNDYGVMIKLDGDTSE